MMNTLCLKGVLQNETNVKDATYQRESIVPRVRGFEREHQGGTWTGCDQRQQRSGYACSLVNSINSAVHHMGIGKVGMRFDLCHNAGDYTVECESTVPPLAVSRELPGGEMPASFSTIGKDFGWRVPLQRVALGGVSVTRGNDVVAARSCSACDKVKESTWCLTS
jgi:hypothetical protein